MDTANKIRIGLATLIAGSLALAACGGGGDEASSSNTNTTITSNRQAAALAADSIDSAIEFGTDPTASAGKTAQAFKRPRLPNFDGADTRLARLAPLEDALFVTLQKNATAARTARSHSGAVTSCTVSGSGQYTTDATHTTYVFTYNACSNGDSILDGTATITQTTDASGDHLTLVYGSGNGIVEDGNDFRITLLAPDGATIDGYLYVDQRSDGSVTSNSAGDTIARTSVNGRQLLVEADGTRYEVAYNNIAAVTTESSDGLQRSVVYNGSADATLLYAGNMYSAHIGYSDFALSARNTGTHIALTLSGSVETASVPARCSDGRYTFVTREALMYNPATGLVESGSIAINDNTVVTFSNGNMVVTVNGDAITYAPGTVGYSCPAN